MYPQDVIATPVCIVCIDDAGWLGGRVRGWVSATDADSSCPARWWRRDHLAHEPAFLLHALLSMRERRRTCGESVACRVSAKKIAISIYAKCRQAVSTG